MKIYDYVIVGGGIAGLAALHRLSGQGYSAILLEASAQCGGLVTSKRINGYLIDSGPNAFLKNYESTMDLIRNVGLSDQMITNLPSAKSRYVYRKGRIIAIPEGPISFVFNRLLSVSAKLRLFFEPFVKRGTKAEESVREFGNRRFGPEVTSNIMDAMVSGVCAGDIDKLDIHSLFPKISMIEKKFRSILLFLMIFKRKTEEKVNNDKTLFRSLKEGMGSIAHTISQKYQERIVVNCKVTSISKKLDDFIVSSEKEKFIAQNLVMATDAQVAAHLLTNVAAKLSQDLNQIPYADMVTITLGYNHGNVKHSLAGFGFLVPRSKGIRVLGGLFTSGLFPGRAPVGKHAIKVYIGGAHDPDAINLPDHQLISLAHEEIKAPLGINGDFDFSYISKIKNAIPQYNLGHKRIKESIYKELAKIENLFLVGNYLEGVSVNEAIRSSEVLMKDKNVPNLVKNDSYLEPFSEEIFRRMKKAKSLEHSLVGKEENLSAFANGHKYFGLHKKDEGWVFREWAPNATTIYLVGEFTDWKDQEQYRLNKTGEGCWEISLPADALKHLDYYQLHVHWNGGNGMRVPSYANYVVQDEKTHLFCARVWDPPSPYKFKHSNPLSAKIAPIIYESHVGMAQIEGKVGSYKEFIDHTLPRVVQGGYNTLQLMAIQEHPYYGSFGYQVSNFFAPSSRSGTPDELKELIDAAHGMGLRVIMDIVHSHAVKNENEGLARFDGTQHQYFHDGGKGQHPAWDTMCFNYGKNEVIHFLLSNCKYWLEEYKFDGFRFDGVTSMLYHSHGLGQAFSSYYDYFNMGVDDDAVIYFMLANKVIKQTNPQAISIAEDMSGMPGIASEIEDGGIGFDYRLAMGLPDFWIKLLKEQKDDAWSMDNLWHEVTNRRADEKAISYAESHDQALVGDKTIIFRLIDKDMYTNMETFNRNLVVDRGIALHKMIRLLTISAARGGYLTFMGNEFGHPEWIDFPREGNGWSYHYARRQWNLVDSEDLCYKFLGAFDTEMVKLIKSAELLSKGDPILLHVHCADHVLIFRREDFIFIFNFDPQRSYSDYMFNAPEGKYMQVLNSDEENFGGFGRVPAGQEHFTYDGKLSAYMPARTSIVLRKI